MKLFALDRFRSIVDLLRVVASVIMIAHGLARIYYRTVDEFGVFLTASHLPFGDILAWTVTLAEIILGSALLLGLYRQVLPWWFVLELTGGIILVHAQNGFFVVGHGRNGVEYAVLLITSFLVIALSRKT